MVVTYAPERDPFCLSVAKARKVDLLHRTIEILSYRRPAIAQASGQGGVRLWRKPALHPDETDDLTPGAFVRAMLVASPCITQLSVPFGFIVRCVHWRYVFNPYCLRCFHVKIHSLVLQAPLCVPSGCAEDEDDDE